jgi:hypothetical protein
MPETSNDYLIAPDLVAAAREFIRSEGCVVSIYQLLDELTDKFGDRFQVPPDTYVVLNLIETLWDDPHIDQVPNTGSVEFAWNKKGVYPLPTATGLKAKLLRHSQIPPATDDRDALVTRADAAMALTTERTPFIAHLVDSAEQFIKERGAAAVSELAVYLSAAGVNVSGDAELTGEDLAYRLDRQELLALPVIASGSIEFVRTIAALLVNRTVDLDATNPALLKLTWDGRWDAHREASKPNRYKSRTGGHYHLLSVRDPGGPQQIAECAEYQGDFSLFQQYLDEIYPRDFVDEGWDAFFIVGCGPDHCRRDEICTLAVEEWGAPHWADRTVFPGVEDSLWNPLGAELAELCYARCPKWPI